MADTVEIELEDSGVYEVEISSFNAGRLRAGGLEDGELEINQDFVYHTSDADGETVPKGSRKVPFKDFLVLYFADREPRDQNIDRALSYLLDEVWEDLMSGDYDDYDDRERDDG